MKNLKWIPAYFVLICITHLLSGQQLADYLSQPFPTLLTASPDGKHIAWVSNDKGSRNILWSTAPFRKVTPLTQFKGDIGVEIPELVVGNQSILFVRGNSPNPKGELANPAMLHENLDKTIYQYNFTTQKTDTLAKGSGIRLSPDGNSLAFISGNQIWIKSLTTKSHPKKITQLRGATSGLVWSPEGDKIAFVSQRTDHSFTGIADLNSKEVYFIDESLDKDRFPSWSPDGNKIAYIRMPTVHQQMLFMPIRESLPWSIRVTDLRNKESKTVFTASEGMGSHFSNSVWIAPEYILWKNENELIFPYEKNGWNQLYALQMDTKKLSHLTKGEGEVEWMAMSRDKNSVFYVTNIGDIDRKHIALVDLNTFEVKNITRGEAIHFNPAESSEGWVFLMSDHARTPWPVLLKADKITEIGAELKSKSFPNDLRKPLSIHITATDGQKIPAQLFLPKNHQPDKKYPATIFLHGGSRRQMLMGFHFSQYYANAFAMNQFMADQGYIVISLNYRSGTGYGVNFREALDYGPFGASEVRDVIGTALYLKGRSDVDTERISLWGGSYGGYLTAHGLAQASDLFACGVDIHGVHDWNDGITIFNTWYDKAEMPEFAQTAFRSSPLNFMSSWKSPVLLIHGDDDRNVAFNQSVRLIEQLRRYKIYHEQIVFPDDVHSFLLHKNWVRTMEATYDFINRNGIERK